MALYAVHAARQLNVLKEVSPHTWGHPCFTWQAAKVAETRLPVPRGVFPKHPGIPYITWRVAKMARSFSPFLPLFSPCMQVIPLSAVITSFITPLF